MQGGDIYTPYPQKKFMETINDVLAKRDTFSHVWELLSPSPEFNNVEGSSRAYWNALTLARQRQIYYTLREQKRRGLPIKENPLFAIQDCTPVPTNYNGRPGLNEIMKTTKMVSAKYGEKYGVFTAQEAQIFELKEVKPLNF